MRGIFFLMLAQFLRRAHVEQIIQAVAFVGCVHGLGQGKIGRACQRIARGICLLVPQIVVEDTGARLKNRQCADSRSVLCAEVIVIQIHHQLRVQTRPAPRF